MTIRPFQSADVDALLNVFRRNVPHAFGEAEIADYAAFLQNPPGTYLVAEREQRIVGACGYDVPDDGQPARLIWIFTHPESRGVGSALVTHCLAAIRQQAPGRLVECRTSQVAYRFFERFGFVLQHTEADYWVPGLDLYHMTLAT